MTLPTSRDAALYADRPGDEIFAKIKHHFPEFMDRSVALQERLVQAILDDMILDHALANALDEIGKVIEYQSQNDAVEKPKFFGSSLMKDAERVGKLNFVLNLCAVVGLDIETTEAVRAAEIERLWNVDGKPKAREGGQVVRLPEEVAGVMKDIARSLKKKDKGGGGAETNGSKYNAAANRLARTLRERSSPHSAASQRGKKPS